MGVKALVNPLIGFLLKLKVFLWYTVVGRKIFHLGIGDGEQVIKGKVSAMDYSDPSDKSERLAKFKEQVKTLSIEELIALAAVMKRRTDDLTEELKVLGEQVAQRRTEQDRRRRQF